MFHKYNNRKTMHDKTTIHINNAIITQNMVGYQNYSQNHLNQK